MERGIIIEQLCASGLSADDAPAVADRLLSILALGLEAEETWRRLAADVLTPDLPFDVHRLLFETTYATRDPEDGPAPAWLPTPAEIDATNAGRLMRELGLATHERLHAWSAREREAFWETMLRKLDIRLRAPYAAMLAVGGRPEETVWLPGARLNIVESCFQAPDESVAIRYQRGDEVAAVSVAELRQITWRVANGLWEAGHVTGDRIAIAMPMTLEAVAAYLGVLAAGGVVVSIADSFAPHEIATRLRITQAKRIITQDCVVRGGRRLPMYEKVVAAKAPPAVVVPVPEEPSCALRSGDRRWDDFLSLNTRFEPVDRSAAAHINILFSSGTTGDPKAVPWNQTTPIKCAADAYLHQDVQPDDVLAWPTNLGWMMGPWLIFAGLINRAAVALYYDAPTGRGFCEFVQRAGVTVLGLVPSLVKAWRGRDLVRGLDWSGIRLFSSTGECSNEEDMLWLMSRAGYRPVVEYCGGTEVGGGYICGTLTRPAVPAAFSTPALGLALEIRDEEGHLTDNGEVFLSGPSIGLSTELLNRDHHEIYHAGTPAGEDGQPLRRHGDQIERLPGGYFRGHGRVDDTMNLGGIKVSSIEIERVLAQLPWVTEAAAIAVNPAGGGPSELVIYAVPDARCGLDPESMRGAMQQAIRQSLNPLFKIKAVIPTEILPRTATNKIMRRRLRQLYRDEAASG